MEDGTLRYPQEKLDALVEEELKWKSIGNYPELVSEAYMWDGETEPTKKRSICRRVEEEQDALVDSGERRGEARELDAETEAAQGGLDISMAAERGMFEKGVMVAGNAVVVEPGVEVSAAVEAAQHASPYLFKEFDTTHMGKGEGQQAYGWGLYFSTNWGVNKWYWGKFGRKGGNTYEVYFKGKVIAGGNFNSNEVRDVVGKALADKFFEEKGNEIYEGDREGVEYTLYNSLVYALVYPRARTLAKQKEQAENDIKSLEEQGIDAKILKRAVKLLEFLIANKAQIKSIVNPVNYVVDLEIEEQELLQWEDRIRDEELRKAVAEVLGRKYRRDDVGEDVYRELTRKLGGQKEASEWLLARGIKGIKYADGFSRNNKEDGTYNYVVFDGRDVKIRQINNREGWSEWKGRKKKGWQAPEEISMAVERVDAVGMTAEDGRKVAARWHAVERSEAVVCDVPEAYRGEGKEARAMLKRITDELRKEPVVFRDGTEATISGKTQREIQQHIADRRVVAAYARIHELARNAQYIHSARNTQKEESRQKRVEQYHYYFARAEFPGGNKGDAYVVISVAELSNGQRVYNMDVRDADEVDANKEEASNLPVGRITNTVVADGASSLKGRIHAVKRFVNHIDRISEKNAGGASFNMEEARGRGMVENGVMVTGNAVVVEPGVDFSAAVEGAQHASPYLFKEFDTSHMGEGEGNQAYGWGGICE